MAWLDLVCPTQCAVCRAPGSLLCARCALPLAAPAVRHVPAPCPSGMPRTWVIAAYDGDVRSALLAFKERGAVGLAQPLGDALARSAVAAASEVVGEVLVVPVPSAARAVRQRGDDVVRLLASQVVRRFREAGRQARLTAVLRQRRGVMDSAGLSAHARAENLADALVVRRPEHQLVRGSAVVVVDDLVTTGATLATATDALTRAGAHVVGAAAVAATQRRKNW